MSTRGKIEDIPEKAGQVMGGGTGGAVLVYVGTNNAEKDRYHKLFKLKEVLPQIRILRNVHQ